MRASFRSSSGGSGRLPALRPENSQNAETGLSEEIIKSVAHTFDVKVIYTFRYNSKGLDCMNGVEACTNLVELDLGNNSISRMEGLDTLLGLERLILNNNRISRVENVEHLTNLRCLNLAGNLIRRVADVNLECLKSLPMLESLNLGSNEETPNPVCRSDEYWRETAAALPGLKVLDDRRTTNAAYCELSRDVDEQIRHPYEPPRIRLPDPKPWLEDMDLSAGTSLNEWASRLNDQMIEFRNSLDECREMNFRLRKRVSDIANGAW